MKKLVAAAIVLVAVNHVLKKTLEEKLKEAGYNQI